MQSNEVVLIIGRFLLLVLVQVLILNHVNFLGYINPFLYILFILIYPFEANNTLLIFLAFLLGLSIDIFSDTGGVHAASSCFLAYARPALLKFSFGISYEYNTIRLSRTALAARITYIGLAVFTHHLVLFSLEIFNFEKVLLILKSILFSGLFSMVLIFCAVLLFSQQKK